MKKIFLTLLAAVMTLSVSAQGIEIYKNGTLVNSYTGTEYKAVLKKTPATVTKYVDLGLSVKWATCNVGADTPEEPGLYFAWGETTGHKANLTVNDEGYYEGSIADGHKFDWSNYKFEANNEYKDDCGVLKYTFADQNNSSNYIFYDDDVKYIGTTYAGVLYKNLTTLQAGDDAATVNLGSEWRMPTQAEWDELFNNTIVTNETLNGVNVKKFTASNSNCIYIPQAGYFNFKDDENLKTEAYYYWDNQLSDIYSDYAVIWKGAGASSGSRYYGCPVRAVYASYVPVTGITLESTHTIKGYATEKLTATTAPDNATDNSITWSSSDESVATVDDNGNVTGVNVGGTATITAHANDGSGIYRTCEVTVAESEATGFALVPAAILGNGGTATLGAYTMLPAGATTTKTYTLSNWRSSDETIATVNSEGVVTSKVNNLTTPQSVTITATGTDESNNTVDGRCVVTINYADMGEAGNWALCNVGATTPEGYGDYFAWGEISPYYTTGHSLDNPCSNWETDKTGYNWASYSLCGGSDNTQKKYNNSSDYGTVDKKTTLESGDDAATKNWGSNWRMPTYDEMQALKNKCTWEWCDGSTTQYNNTTVKGYKVTASNGSSIFLPAAGYRGGSGLGNAGSYGHYWSSSLYTDDPSYAWYLYFYSDDQYMRGDYRFCGRSVRPVRASE